MSGIINFCGLKLNDDLLPCSDVNDNFASLNTKLDTIINYYDKPCPVNAVRDYTAQSFTGPSAHISSGVVKMYSTILRQVPSDITSVVLDILTGIKSLRQHTQEILYSDAFYKAWNFGKTASQMTPTLLAGKVAVVTGGSSGLGFNLAVMLAELGCNVYVCGRDVRRFDRERATALKTEIELKQVKVLGNLEEFNAAAATANLVGLDPANYAIPYNATTDGFLKVDSQYAQDTVLYKLPHTLKLDYGGVTGVDPSVFDLIHMTEVDLRVQSQVEAWLANIQASHSNLDYLILNAATFFGTPDNSPVPLLVESAFNKPRQTLEQIVAATPTRWTNPTGESDDLCSLMQENTLIAAFKSFGFEYVKQNTQILSSTSFVEVFPSLLYSANPPGIAPGRLTLYTRGKSKMLDTSSSLGSAGFKTGTIAPVRLLTESGFATNAFQFTDAMGWPLAYSEFILNMDPPSLNGSFFTVGSYDFYQNVTNGGDNYIQTPMYYARIYLGELLSGRTRNLCDTPTLKGLFPGNAFGYADILETEPESCFSNSDVNQASLDTLWSTNGGTAEYWKEVLGATQKRYTLEYDGRIVLAQPNGGLTI